MSKPVPAVRVPAAPTKEPAKRGLRILLVEDHEPTLKMMTRLLEQFGHSVQSAATVKAAIATADSGQFDLMISDLGLPDGSGCDVMQHLRGRTNTKGIAISGYGMREDIDRSMDAGFTLHLTKPVDLQQLLSAVNKVGNGGAVPARA